MRVIVSLGWIILTILNALTAQSIGPYHLSWEEEKLFRIPPRQSFAGFQWEDYLILVGGRMEGLHETVPFRSFPADLRADYILLIETHSGKRWARSLSDLPVEIREQLAASNHVYSQHGEFGLCIGGYGYSELQEEHITFPRITRLHLPTLVSSIQSGHSLQSSIQSLEEEFFRLTGAGMILLQDQWFIFGGQSFMGRYNPVGEDAGPGFTQSYSNAIRSFTIRHMKDSFAILNKAYRVDSIHCHKRDYNLVPQVLPDGKIGATAFSGVFRYETDLPWLQCVDFTPDTLVAPLDWKQYLNQYHCAHIPLFDRERSRMQTVFFGGISQFYLENDSLKEDLDVPFTPAISMMQRDLDGQSKEYLLGRLPDYMGTSAQFIPNEDLPFYTHNVIDVQALKRDTVFLGWIIGGIGVDSANVLFTNEGDQSWAWSTVQRVYLVASSGQQGSLLHATHYFQPQQYIDSLGVWKVSFRTLEQGQCEVVCLSDDKQEVIVLHKGELPKGIHHLSLTRDHVPRTISNLIIKQGRYHLEIKNPFIQKTSTSGGE